MTHSVKELTCIPGAPAYFLAIVVSLMTFPGGYHGSLQQYRLSLFVGEDAPIGTLVGEVSGEQFSPPFARWISQATDNRTMISFNVELTTGRITTKGKLDREQQDRHNIIISTSFLSPKLLIIDVRILDINDITPAFLYKFINSSVPESAPKHHKIPLGIVRDEDLGENTTQKIEIIAGNDDNEFNLQIKNSSSTDKMLDLVVNYQLDYERTSAYHLVVRATDGGGRFSEMKVTINVLDQNDNEPVFNISKYSAKVPENVPVGTLILQVHATDTDSGENSRIFYSIDRRSDPETYFTISTETGWVRVNKPLDYETRDRFSLTLQARDSGISPQLGTAALDIVVENMGEQAANISLDFQPPFSGGHVPEDAPVGTLVAVVAVDDDPVNSVSSDVDVFLYRSEGFFTLKAGEYLGLYVSTQLDREKISEFEMTLQFVDNGQPPLRANKVFKVVVDDVNDNPPVFEHQEYFATVEETAEVGSEALRVAAMDADFGANAQITYHIDNGSQNMGWFAVDSNTGIITTTATLDCNINSQPLLVIVATDGGDPPQIGSAQVVISVQNVNDKAPEFVTSFYSIKVAENRRVGDCILMVSAKDPECGTNSPVTYRLAQMLAPPREFRVDSVSGAVCIRSELDFETTSSYQLQVEAVDSDGLSTQAVVQVEITDVNDNHPRFEPREYPINVLSGVEPGQLVTVQSRDRDSGIFGTVSYSIAEGNDKGYFDVNSDTGSVSLMKPLPETEGVFSLRILATDGGGMTSIDPAVVTVSVISGRVHPPIFTPTIYNFSISEDAPMGRLVGQVQASLDDTGSNMDIVYSSLFQTADWFSVDKRTGSILTKNTLDRELHPFVVLSIQAQTGFPPVYTIAQVNVTVLDVNDNEPYFLATAMLELEVFEDEKPEAALYIARANDPDVGNNGTVSYHLYGEPSHTFSINEHTGEISLVSELDFELHQQYLLVVVAQDLGTPVQLCSNMTLTVKVKDVNDNAPNFSKPVYEFYISENVEVGYNVGRVIATDDDSSHNKRLSFNLKNSVYDSVFGISSVDGVLRTRAVLDREHQEIYEITVEAVDHGSSIQLSAVALIRVIITDINDHAPVFSRGEYIFYIHENVEPGSLVGNVIAQDLDSGHNGHIYFFFSGPQTHFSINSHTGEIRTQIPLDRELAAEHIVLVYASDKGDNPRTAVTKVRVLVQDINDNDPRFLKQGPFYLKVSENRKKGTEVVTIVAKDADDGDNARIIYFFDEDKSENAAIAHFEINSRSGKVTTKEVLDYETQSTYHLTVVARDNGKVFRQTSQLLTVSVVDSNDQAALHHSHFISFDCVENTKVGTIIGQVKVTSLDSGDNEDIGYNLVGGNVFSSFSVQHTSGMITVVGEIDFEMVSTQFLSIQAVSSSYGRSRSINISVTINIIDMNDNSPEFDQDPVLIPRVAEDTPRNYMIHQFSATDRDSGVNGTVLYFIESCSGTEGNQSPYLDIDKQTGKLYVSRQIDFETIQTISMIVRAEDSCPFLEHIQHSLTTVIIHVTDINDNAPEFRSSNSAVVSEDEASGTIILLVVAVDADSNIDGSGNNLVRYHIVNGNEDERFLLEADTGYLRISETLDYETRTNYILNISAEDSGTPRMSSYQSLQITVTDVNDNTPVFDTPVFHASVSENMRPQMSVIRVQATDADTGENGELKYFIPSGTADDMFTVDSQTGLVATKVLLDREVKDTYIVTVFVQDGAYPVHFCSCSIIITVGDQNDNSPIFRNRLYVVKIPENRAQNSVLTLVASDRDVGDNAKMTYSITSGNDGKFRIDPHRGILSTEPLDREGISTYNLTITASDHGDTAKTATTVVMVTVLDENDNNPIFDEMVYTASISEDTKEGQVVLTVTATDLDHGQNGHVTYLLESDTDGHFEVNSSTGEIYTRGVFDTETVPSYSFVIIASDNGVFGPRNATAHVIVAISDVNDNPPIFSVVPYTASLNLFTPPDTYILTVAATDLDLNSNGLVEYSLQADTGSNKILEDFYIDRSSGEVYTKNAIFRASGHYSLLVVATDLASYPSVRLSSTGFIEITVGSGEGIQLEFSQPEYRVEIPEHYMGDKSVLQVTATYTGPYSKSQSVVYSFANGNEKSIFKIDGESGQVTVADAALLDYEIIHHIRLVARATNHNHHAYATIWINLTDVNDNIPEFFQAKYVSAIWENNQLETEVAQVLARDKDRGLNGDITYTIIGGNGDYVFKIPRAEMGIVVTNSEAAPLDREAQPGGYRLIIEARDKGSPSRFSTCVLVVSIIDDNDTPPFFPKIGAKNISENCDVGYVVAMATANDVDLNPTLVYDFTTDGNPDNTFSLDRFTGRLTLAKPLDYEKQFHYSIGIQVTDGKPDHVRSTWLDVYVNDENDHSPVFSQSNYEVFLPELTGPQQPVTTVMATDADSGYNAQVTYSLASTAGDNFYINTITGTIYTSKTAIFTSWESIIHLVVIAKDNGAIVQSSKVVVSVHVTAINKHTPRFVETVKYLGHISESAKRGDHILQVSAVDEDSKMFRNNISYTLAGPGSDLFFVHPRTGDIFFKGGVHSDFSKRYNLTAGASDGGVPPKNGSIPVMIIKNNINHNPPVFSQEKYSITLDENSESLQVFLELNASNADFGIDSEITFSITSGNSKGIFSNPDNAGRLMISEGMTLDYELHPFHHLIIKAVDCNNCPSASPHLLSFVTVDINVRDINEFRPRFPLKHYVEVVAENSDIGTVVFRAHANDDDGGEMGVVTYSLVNEINSFKFAIDAATGEVTTQFVFDYETDRVTHLYNLVIIAADRGQNYDMTDVTIQVVDVDEFNPLLEEGAYIFEVAGSAKLGDFVGQVSAYDDDGGEAGRVVYSFLEASDYFMINPFTGNITVATTLHDDPALVGYGSNNRKKRALITDRMDLIIQVSSGQTGSRQGTALCTININRTCPGCAAPLEEMNITPDVDGGILAGIIIACILVIVLTIFGIIFLIYQHRKSGKAMASYLSDSVMDFEPATQNTHNRNVCADVIRVGLPLSHNQFSCDVLDQSPKSVSSVWGSERIENKEEDIGIINSDCFLNSTHPFCQKLLPPTGIHHNNDTLSEQAVHIHQKYLASLDIDSSNIWNVNPPGNNYNYSSNCNKNKRLVLSAEEMHLFSADNTDEAAIYSDMMDLGPVNEAATLKTRTQGMHYLRRGPHSFGNIVIGDEITGDSTNWDTLINWSPQYQPLAEVFSEIAKLKDEYTPANIQPPKTISEHQFNSKPEEPIYQEASTALPLKTQPSPARLLVSTNRSCDLEDYQLYSSSAPARAQTMYSQLQEPHHFIYNNGDHSSHHVHPEGSHILYSYMPQPTQCSCPYNSQEIMPQPTQCSCPYSSQENTQIHIFPPHVSTHPTTNLTSPHQQHHHYINSGHHHHPPHPPNLPPDPHQHHTLSRSFASHNPHSHPTNATATCLPFCTTPHPATPSLPHYPVSTRAPHILPIASSRDHSVLGNANSRHKSTSHFTSIQSPSSISDQELDT